MLKVLPLRPDRIDVALPLMRLVIPQLTVDEWRRYARDLVRVPGTPATRGIMVAAAPNGVIRGAFIYEVVGHGGNGQAPKTHNLTVRHVIMPRLGQEMTIAILVDSMQELARERGCTTITAVLAPDAERKIAYFRTRGYEVVISETARTLAPVPPGNPEEEPPP